MIEWSPLCITDLFQNNPKWNTFQKILIFSLPSLRSYNIFVLPTKSWKKHPKNLYTYGSWEVFFSAALTAQKSPVLHFRLINSFIQPSLVGSLFVRHHFVASRFTSGSFVSNYTTIYGIFSILLQTTIVDWFRIKTRQKYTFLYGCYN